MKDSREKFEAICRERMVRRGYPKRDTDLALRVVDCNTYYNGQITLAWEFWQAAVEACEEIDINDCKKTNRDSEK